MGRGRVGADEQDAGRLVKVGHRVGGGAGAQGPLHAQGGGGVADPGAAVDVVGADHYPKKLLHQVVFFVGAAGGGDAGQGIRAVAILDLLEAAGAIVQGLVPGRRLELAVPADQGRR